MNDAHPVGETLAFLEALSGEYAGEPLTRRSWRRSEPCEAADHTFASVSEYHVAVGF